MAKSHKPRAGSLAYRPRKRAKKETPRIHSWPGSRDAKPLGFAAYKAGMTYVIAIDQRKKTPTSGSEIFIPVTILDAPAMVIAGFRIYREGYMGKETIADVWAKDVSPDLEKRLSLPKKRNPEKEIKELEQNMEEISDIVLLVHTQPRLTSLPKKVPDLMEIPIGGEIQDKLNYVREHLGKEINAEEIFEENSHLDATAVTKGKGFQGIVKRFGVRKQPRKAGKGRRHMGSGGAWTPSYKLWTEPLPGQLGYHTRTEYNKMLLKVGKDGKDVTPKGGFLNYGLVKGNYLILKGSLPGPSKRLIRLSNGRRAKKPEAFEIKHISLDSKQGV